MSVEIQITLIRVSDGAGQPAGTVVLSKPAASMAVLAAVAAGGDLRHFERMQHVAKPARRPAAILFALATTNPKLRPPTTLPDTVARNLAA